MREPRTAALDNTWLYDAIPGLDEEFLREARARQEQLTKPAGSLGRLETLGITLAAMQRSQQPTLERVGIVVFAADHGVATEGVSAFPQAVTAEMIRNFARGGAAISVLARAWQAEFLVINVGTVSPLEELPRVVDRRVGPGTANFARQEAMTTAQLAASLAAGREAVEWMLAKEAQLFIGGEMGIGNTTAATAVACALLGWPAQRLAGPGTGLDQAGIMNKISVIDRALSLHPGRGPLETLRCLGGFEIAALVGAYLHCGQRGIPVLVDGFITTVAALVAVKLRPELRPWLIYSHRSAEPGHIGLLQALEADPLLDLGMRLGEGSGAAVALPLLRAAASLHGSMATFAEAEVSTL